MVAVIGRPCADAGRIARQAWLRGGCCWSWERPKDAWHHAGKDDEDAIRVAARILEPLMDRAEFSIAVSDMMSASRVFFF